MNPESSTHETSGYRESTTPILDRLLPLPAPAKPGLARHFSTLLLVFGLYVVPYALVYWRAPFLDPFRHWIKSCFLGLFADQWAGFRLLLVGFSIVLAGLAAVAVHEAGHLLTGVAAGFRFEAVRFGPVHIDRSLKLSRYRAVDHEGLGAVWFSTESMRHRPVAVACMTASGPMANLIAAWVMWVLPGQVSLISGGFILISAALGVINLLPLNPDGKRLLTLMRSRAAHERWLATEQLRAWASMGNQTQLPEPDLVAEATSIRDNSEETALAHAIAYAVALARKDILAAAEALETGLRFAAFATPRTREGLVFNAAIFQADMKRRPDLAEQWLNDLSSEARSSSISLQIEVRILEERGDIEGALMKIDECEKGVLAQPAATQDQAFLQRLREWKMRLGGNTVHSALAPAPQG